MCVLFAAVFGRVTVMWCSAALLIGYLMETTLQSYEYVSLLLCGLCVYVCDAAIHAPCSDVLAFVHKRRFCVFPNVGFAQQLREYHYVLQAIHAQQGVLCCAVLVVVCEPWCCGAGMYVSPRAVPKRCLDDDAYER